VGGAQLLARVEPAALAAQPFAVKQTSARERDADARADVRAGRAELTIARGAFDDADARRFARAC
jgi:hypothetical protein